MHDYPDKEVSDYLLDLIESDDNESMQILAEIDKTADRIWEIEGKPKGGYISFMLDAVRLIGYKRVTKVKANWKIEGF